LSPSENKEDVVGSILKSIGCAKEIPDHEIMRTNVKKVIFEIENFILSSLYAGEGQDDAVSGAVMFYSLHQQVTGMIEEGRCLWRPSHLTCV